MSRAKAKGRRAEHDVVNRHLAIGLHAERVPLSGSLGGKYSDDVDLPYGKGEVKARANAAGWLTIKKWMKGCASLFLKEDRVPPLVVLRWDVYEELLTKAYGLDTSGHLSHIVNHAAHTTTHGGSDDGIAR
jgi:hypothetical protein